MANRSGRPESPTFFAKGTISSANITGTAAGQLGHSEGFEMVPSYGADKVVELVSCVLVMDFDTAAYTAGGNTGVKLSGGGAALTGVAANTDFIQASADKVIQLVPLAATFLTPVVDKGLNLVSASAPTNPGTAAGVIHYKVTYKVHPTNL